MDRKDLFPSVRRAVSDSAPNLLEVLYDDGDRKSTQKSAPPEIFVLYVEPKEEETAKGK